MKQSTWTFNIRTQGKNLYNITDKIENWVEGQEIEAGLLTVFICHTSASLVIQENADKDVLYDLDAFMDRLVPRGDPAYRHTAEGPDDMPAHIRSALTQTQLSIPLAAGKLVLGIWQGIYLFEHRDHPHQRKVVLHLLGE